jgi:hypothetical protein
MAGLLRHAPLPKEESLTQESNLILKQIGKPGSECEQFGYEVARSTFEGITKDSTVESSSSTAQ